MTNGSIDDLETIDTKLRSLGPVNVTLASFRAMHGSLHAILRGPVTLHLFLRGCDVLEMKGVTRRRRLSVSRAGGRAQVVSDDDSLRIVGDTVQLVDVFQFSSANQHAALMLLADGLGRLQTLSCPDRERTLAALARVSTLACEQHDTTGEIVSLIRASAKDPSLGWMSDHVARFEIRTVT